MMAYSIILHPIFGKPYNFIVPVFNYNYDRKELTQSQKLGMLTLIYKKNDPLSRISS